MGFPVGTYRWEAEALDGKLLSRENGDSTTKLDPKALKAFRLRTGSVHAMDVFVEQGILLNDLEITARLIEIRNTGIFDRITLTLRKQFPLQVGASATTENYLVRAQHAAGSLFLMVMPGRIIVTTNESDLPE